MSRFLCVTLVLLASTLVAFGQGGMEEDMVDDRLLLSIKSPQIVVFEFNSTVSDTANVTIGFKTGPNLPSTMFSVKCVPSGQTCAADAVGGVNVTGELPLVGAYMEATLRYIPFLEGGFSCFVAASRGKLNVCMQAKNAAPLPAPATIVRVPVLSIFLTFLGETVQSFTQEKKDKLCSDLINASKYDPTLIVCSVVSVVPSIPVTKKRALLQATGVNVTTDMIFNVLDATETSSAFTAAEDLIAVLSNETSATEILGPNTTVSQVTETTQEDLVPVNPPPPGPTPSIPSPPTAPYDPTAEPAFGCVPRLDVSWKEPGFTSTITEYIVSCESSGAPTVNKTVGASVTSASLDVEVSNQYICTVVSQGPTGTSDEATTQPVTYSYPSKCLPSAPTNVEASDVNGQPLQRTISWTASTSPDLAVAGYEVYCKANDGTNRTVTVDATKGSTVIGSGTGMNAPLEQGTVYTCGVFAYNDAGNGAAGEASEFITDVLISGLGNGVPQASAYPNWGKGSWYSADTKKGSDYILGLYYTMPVYFGNVFPSEFWTVSNDDLIASEFIMFNDTSMAASSDQGYVFMANGLSSSSTDKVDFINWFGNDSSSVIPLPTLYNASSFGVQFRAALTPASTVLKYSIKVICSLTGGYSATPSLVYRFTSSDEDWNTYTYNDTSAFAIFWTTQDTIPGGPTNGQFIGLDGQTGSESTNQFSFEYWASNTSNNVLKECLTNGTAFGSGYGIGAIKNEQTLKIDWLRQSFTWDGARINFITQT